MQDGRLGLGTRGYDHTILGIRPTSMFQDQATMVMTCFLPPKLPLNHIILRKTAMGVSISYCISLPQCIAARACPFSIIQRIPPYRETILRLPLVS